MDELTEEPTEEQVALILSALDEAAEAAERIIESLDRTHHLMQDNIREVREARDVARWSNAFAKARSRENVSK